MERPRLEARTWCARTAIVFAFCVWAAHTPAHASVIYDFSMPANGEVDAIDIKVTFPDFLPAGDILVFNLSDPPVKSNAGALPIDLTNSVVAIDVNDTETLVGMRLVDLDADVIAYTFLYPEHFFVFGRTPSEAGVFNSTSGILVSDYALDTTTPTAALSVTVPEPVSALLLGLGLGAAGIRRFRAHSRSRKTEAA